MNPKREKKARRSKPTKRRGPRITRVTTRAGDQGVTSLVGGRKVKKSDPRIESYGVVDELMVWIGNARQAIGASERQADPKAKPRRSDPMGVLDSHLRYLQNLLFTINADLATRIEDRWEGMPLVKMKDIRYIERLIDAYNDALPALEDFILPAGGPLALALHSCRVVCRRAERAVQALADREEVGSSVLPFLNRLSDLFFVWARWVVAGARECDGDEVIWDRDLRQPAIPRLRPRR